MLKLDVNITDIENCKIPEGKKKESYLCISNNNGTLCPPVNIYAITKE